MADLHLVVIPPSRDMVREDDRRLAALLAERIDGEVRFGRHDRLLYATDASIYQVEPLGVVVPRTVEDVMAALAFAAEHRLPVLARGGGTSLAGQAVNRALIIDTSKYLRRVVHVDPMQRTCRVEPGVVLDQLNAALAPHGLVFGPDVATSSHATLGGMIGTNSAGARSILYGRTVENLLAVDAILPDGRRFHFDEGAFTRDPRIAELTRQVAAVVQPLAGEIRARFPRTKRRVNGYNIDLMLDQIERSTPGTLDRVNLAHLVCGSEGTLAMTLEATLQLLELPAHRGLAIVAYDDVKTALAQLTAILGTNPAALELLDDVVIAMARENTECRRYVDLLPVTPSGMVGAVFYVEYFARSREELGQRFLALERLVAPNRLETYVEPAAMMQAWKLRKSGEPLLHAVPGHRKPFTFIEDTAVNPEVLTDFVRDFSACVERHGTRAAYYAHASVGCLHIRPLVDIRDPADRRIMESIAQEVTDLVKRYQGALSGEHGDGRVRSHLLERFFGRAICDGFRAIKAIFDPENRMNPGNIVEPGPMLANLRVQPDKQQRPVPPVSTFFHYDHGFGEAVEACNGAGVCRKTSGGTMCPSYRATLEERHATRGRGNALRLAITGQVRLAGHEPSWNDPETLATLELCLSCKACKSECPSNVDIAKLKAEYLGQRYGSGVRSSFADQVIGNVRSLNRAGSILPWLANTLSELPPVRAMVNRVMGIDPRRSLPRFGPSLFRWHRRRQRETATGEVPKVVLFADCFTTCNEPVIGRSAVGLLESLGYEVLLPDVGCCGRSLMSVGLLEQARHVCRATALALANVVRQDDVVAVIGIEPSCVSAIKDDWIDLDMGLDRSELRALASRTMLAEEFIEQRWTSHPRGTPRPRPDRVRDIVLHGHCHQKALWGIETSAALLRRLVGAERLRVLDSGCCGMAGSFGFARRRFDLSMAIGEQSLFASIRQAEGHQIAAPGTSCRHQILDAMGRRALHPVEIAADIVGVLND